MSKKEIAAKIFRDGKLNGLSRKQIMDQMIRDADMSYACANTYYGNFNAKIWSTETQPQGQPVKQQPLNLNPTQIAVATQRVATELFNKMRTTPVAVPVTPVIEAEQPVAEVEPEVVAEAEQVAAEVIDYESMTMRELVELYNKHAATPVTKFRDKATAIARVRALIEEPAVA